MPAALTALPAGNRSTRNRSRATSVKVAGVNTVKKPFTITARKTYASRYSYCARSCAGSRDYRPPMSSSVLHWSNYCAKAIAQIQARGMLIDVPLWNLVQENKAAVIGELLRQFDPSYGSDDPIYTPEGEWSYARFENWLVSAGVVAWPRLESGQLDTDGDAFRLMYHVPGIEGLHALTRQPRRDRARETADRRRRPQSPKPISVWHRHRPQRARQKPVQRARRMRGFHGGAARRNLVYLDWRSQEVGIAAALSDDEQLMRDYQRR